MRGTEYLQLLEQCHTSHGHVEKKTQERVVRGERKPKHESPDHSALLPDKSNALSLGDQLQIFPQSDSQFPDGFNHLPGGSPHGSIIHTLDNKDFCVSLTDYKRREFLLCIF